MKNLPQLFITRQNTADKFVLKEMMHPADLFVEHQQFVDYCPWEVELKLKLNFGLLGGEKDNQKCESRKKIESFCHGGKSNY